MNPAAQKVRRGTVLKKDFAFCCEYCRESKRNEGCGMMRFVREVLIQSLVVIVVMYLVQIIKYWIVGEVRPSPLGVTLSLVGGYLLSEVIVKKLNEK